MNPFIIIFSFLCLSVCSQNSKMNLKGTIRNNTASELTIMTSSEKVVAILPIKHNRVNGIVQQLVGFYKMSIGSEYTDIYVDNGTLNFTIDLNEFDASIKYTGSLAVENNYLATKLLHLENYRDSNMYYIKDVRDFLDSLAKIYSYFDTLLSNPLLNQEFKRKQWNQNQIERYNVMMSYAEYHPILAKKENFELPDTYFHFLKKVQLNDRENAGNREYVSLVNKYIKYVLKKEFADKDDDKRALKKLELLRQKVHLAEIKDAILKMDYTFTLKRTQRLNELTNAYIETAINEKLKRDIEQYSYRLLKFATGSPAPEFSLANHQNQKKSLADYKGKYIYLDVWATWCGPCKKELPYYEDLKTQYQGKNIEFVSVCVWDKQEAWSRFLTEKKLGGEQLFNPQEDNSFTENYMIQGVPTFVLIDTEGKLILRDAERPSDPALKSRLDSLLK